MNTHGTATKKATAVYTATKTAGTHSRVVNVLGTAGRAWTWTHSWTDAPAG